MNVLAILDPFVFIPVISLAGISLFLVASTAANLFWTQAIFFIIGFFLLYIFSLIDCRIWSKFCWWIYVFSLIFLLVSFLGPNVRGATRWISIGGLRMIQPSEVMKPLVIIVFAQLLINYKPTKLLSVGKLIMFFLPVIILIFKQPDLGNVLVYMAFFISMIIISGLQLKYIISGFIISGILLPLFWFLLQVYQRLRLISFLNPYADPVGAGYNALQSMIAIGSGQLFGLGLGRGTQSRLLFLPEYHTDFVFASLGEELGFFGGMIVIILYLVLLIRILKIASGTESNFGKLLTMGIFSQLFIQVLINIGMNLGILPITGITLPLISYGGSSIISTFIDLGLVISAARLNKKSLLVIK